MRTHQADLLTSIILAIFHNNGHLLSSGDRLVASLGLTSSRWQVLGAVALSAMPLSAPQIGAAMGITRQGSQQQIALLIKTGLLEPLPNPANKRSPLYALTQHGRNIYTQLEHIQACWANQIVVGFTEDDLITTNRVLDRIALRLAIAPDWSDAP